LAVSVCSAAAVAANIPATPLMTVYQFDGPRALPYYSADHFQRYGPTVPAGTLTQGSAILPCLVLHDGKPLTDKGGTPYVGFEIVFDSADATPAASERFTAVARQRGEMKVTDHHCRGSAPYVIDVRRLFPLGKAPSFDPPRAAQTSVLEGGHSTLDRIVRAFHASPQCEEGNRRLAGRREALQRAWTAFAAAQRSHWPADSLARARQLDFVMRTALYEGHLGRGCSAYGACERNVIALSIRNRAVETCRRNQGCRSPGDFEGVASAISQYNIWDEVLAQTTGLTSCFLRPDLTAQASTARLQAMYEQSVADVEAILYGGASGLRQVFPGGSSDELAQLRHYYHPPAMGKCFPDEPRLEYVSGAVARRGARFALIANTRIVVGAREGDGYRFESATVDEAGERDIVRRSDDYPGFIIDGRKIELRTSSRCAPYGVPHGCRFEKVGRYRKTPGWLSSGRPLKLACTVQARGNDCREEPLRVTAEVGGACDTWMQPVARVP
jgi:hypothetical protein